SGYQGPHVIFSGPLEADILTNMFYHNLKDVMDKTEGGIYRTSTPGAANFGRYQGFGTWKDGVGFNSMRAWSRDFGPTLMELAELGYQDRAEKASIWAFDCADWYRQHKITYADGTPTPPHWTRCINVQDEK